MEELFKYIRKFGILNKEEELLIAQGLQEITILKGEAFIEAGKVSRKIAFVKEGVFRSLYYNKQGDDFTRYFIYEGRFIGDFYGFADQIPALEYIEAVTDGVLLAIDLDYFKKLEKEIAVWPVLFARLHAFVAENKLKVASTMLNLDAKSRYIHFLDHYPGLANRVPQSMLASYLGITPSSLSRIRRNIV
ncbi:cyclic nucleotide-binding protein [Chryseobacterium shigense]|uniref:cAMP-binding domain of CRP or a regulatory subunit of cAMP-dependent protein kinases n=1 Tax=Chryseobacterium shigense TaxID=297244 RepID=A0A1N7IVU3_9FLAO|nr:Crp/Fnr family transcriptional regulator [Chryseobacterium shigense]PQA92358.1 cyclic nucleotide-binding protein [Chryseobacterium shigense]SIS41223.1 cAMP-binding domain of CRP or a regulatory subunit of cAMP-dependent protein kinases [Chryseobacterium shigense]